MAEQALERFNAVHGRWYADDGCVIDACGNVVERVIEDDSVNGEDMYMDDEYVLDVNNVGANGVMDDMFDVLSDTMSDFMSDEDEDESVDEFDVFRLTDKPDSEREETRLQADVDLLLNGRIQSDLLENDGDMMTESNFRSV